MNKSQLLQAFKPELKEIDVQGTKVEIQSLSLEGRGKVLKAFESNATEAQAVSVAFGCPAFTEADLDDIKGLPGSVVQEISDAILKESGMVAEDDSEEKKD